MDRDDSYQTQADRLLECIARRTEGCSFHYRDAVKWMRKDHPGTYGGKTPHHAVHRDLSRSNWIENVGHGKGIFRIANPASRPLPAREQRKYKKVAKLLRKAIAILERPA